jgi:hypothetical protein
MRWWMWRLCQQALRWQYGEKDSRARIPPLIVFRFFY